MERVSVARMVTVKPQGWVDAALGMGGSGPAQQCYQCFIFPDIKLCVLVSLWPTDFLD